MNNSIRKKTRKIITLFLALCLIVGAVPFAAIGASAEEETLASVDPISISDLGMGMSYSLAKNVELTPDFTPADQQKRSAVVKFDVDFTGDVRIGFQAWTECLWIASDCVRFGKNDSIGWEENYQSVSNGRHSVEFGKLAVLTGTNAGKDYFYVKLDGELVLSYYTSAYIASPISKVWFYTNKTGTVLYDNKPVVSYAPYDEITVSDLTGESSFTFSSTDTYFNYLPTVDNNTKVFRFNLVQASSSDIQIGMNDWDQRLRMTGYDFHLINDQTQSQTFTFTKGKSYEVEFGCKLIISGEHSGMDYVYVKIDGMLYLATYTSHKTAQLCRFLFYGSNVTISDVDGIENRFDTYDVISLSDLGISGNLMPSGDVHKTFDGISSTGSKVFEFDYNHNQSSTAANLVIGFNGWSRRMQVFNKTQIVLYTGSGNDTREEFNGLNIAANVDHRIKYGNIRITGGVNAGKDLQFAVLDGKLVAYEITDPLPDDLRTVMISANSGDGTVETVKNADLSGYTDYKSANIDDEVHYFVGDSIVTPEFDGDGFIAWKSNGKLYPVGAVIPVEDSIKLEFFGNLSIATQCKGDEARLVVVLTDDDETIKAYDDVQIDVTIDGKQFNVQQDSVYTAFYNDDKMIAAESVGCTYFAILEIGDAALGAKEVALTASYIKDGVAVKTGRTCTTNGERIYGV